MTGDYETVRTVRVIAFVAMLVVAPVVGGVPAGVVGVGPDAGGVSAEYASDTAVDPGDGATGPHEAGTTAPTAVDGTVQVDVAASDLPGDGSRSDPYEISNASELQAMEDDLDAHYELVGDIDAAGTAQWNDGSGFDPIGTPPYRSGPPFSGSLDGHDHVITGLTIDRPNENHVGVFGSVGPKAFNYEYPDESGGFVANVSLRDVNVTGSEAVGGLVGELSGKVVSSSVSGAVSGNNRPVGGLVGSSIYGGTVTSSYATATVDGKYEVGGLVGYNREASRVTLSYASGAVDGTRNVGGLVGRNSEGTVKSSYATGTVSGNSKTGGFIGRNVGLNTQTTGSVETSYAAATVDGSFEVGGFIGVNEADWSATNSYWDTGKTGKSSSGGGTGLTTAEMTGEAAKTNLTGFDFTETWQVRPDGYPALAWENVSSGSASPEVDLDASDLAGDGTSNDPYVITNASELQAMEDDPSANYELASDVDASSTAQWNDGRGFDPVGGRPSNGSTPPAFNGSLDGTNHTIFGLTINRSDENEVGLFGGVGGSGPATITNVSLRGVTVTGSNRVGGLVGENGGTVRDVAVFGTVTGTEDFGRAGGLVGDNRGTIRAAAASGTVSTPGQYAYVGGLAGENGGTIRNARASSEIIGMGDDAGGLVGRNDGGTIRDATASGTVTGSGYDTGGLAGTNLRGTIRNATASVDVTGENRVGGLVGTQNLGGTVRNATASGSVTGDDAVGGLVGDNSRGSIQDAFAVGSVSGSSNVGGLVGDNTFFDQDEGTVEDSYWDVRATGQGGSAGSATGLTTAEMQGPAAASNMSKLEFGTAWQTQPDGYPALVALQTGPDPPRIPPAPSNFTVTVDSTTGPVVAGETLTVSTTITNTGGMSGTQTVALTAEGGRRDSTRITLSPGENDTVTLAWTTTRGDAGTHTATITSANDTAATAVTVNAPENFTTAVDSTNSPVTAGETLRVAATITNTGDVSGTQAVSLAINGTQRDASQVALSPGENTTTTLNWTTAGGDTGTYTATVSSANDTTSTTVSVQALANTTTTIDSTNAPVEPGKTLSINATIGNVGALRNTQDVALSVNGTEESTRTVTLDPGSTREITFTYPVTETDVPAITIVISSDGAPVTRTLRAAYAPDCSRVEFAGGNGTQADPYRISTVDQLQCVDSDGLSETAHYELVNDIDAFETSEWNGGKGFDPIAETPGFGENSDIRPFDGAFDGNGYVIRGLTIDRTDELFDIGLFASNEGTINNVGVVNADIAGSSRVGGLVGYNKGEAPASSEGTVKRSFATGSVSGVRNSVGGLVGRNTADLTKSYARVTVDGRSDVGGLTGENVNGGSVSESYSTGSVSSASWGDIGGLIGDGGTSANSYWDVTTSGLSTSAGGTGLTTAEMTGEAAETNMSGFDFADTWQVRPEGYPALSREDVPAETSVANFTTRIRETTAPVLEGDTLSVEASVTNTGDFEGTQTVRLTTNGTRRDATRVTLSPGERTIVTFDWATTGDDAGQYTATIASANDTATTAVTVDAPANFTTSVDSTSSPVTAGDTLNVAATITNIGDVSGTQTVSLAINGTQRDASQVTLSPGESTTLTLNWTTTRGDAGTYTATISSANDTAPTTVAVQAPANVTATIDATNHPVVAGGTLAVNATLTNVGDIRATRNVTLAVNGSIVHERAITLDGEEVTAINVSYATDLADAPRVDLTLNSTDDTANATASILKPANLTVEIDGTNAPVMESEDLVVNATVRNEGDLAGSGGVTLSTPGGSTVTERNVTVPAGESEPVTLTWTTEVGDAGNGTVGVAVGDDTATARVAITEADPADRITGNGTIMRDQWILDYEYAGAQYYEIAAVNFTTDGARRYVYTSDPSEFVVQLSDSSGLTANATDLVVSAARSYVTGRNVTLVTDVFYGEVLAADRANVTTTRVDVTVETQGFDGNATTLRIRNANLEVHNDSDANEVNGGANDSVYDPRNYSLYAYTLTEAGERDELVGTTPILSGSASNVTVPIDPINETTDVRVVMRFPDGEPVEVVQSDGEAPIADEATVSVTKTVTGTITGVDTGEPVPNATVRIEGVGTRTTNATGAYRFERVPMGTYDVTVERAGYDVGETTLNVTVDSNTRDVALRENACRVITGSGRYTLGEPVSDVRTDRCVVIRASDVVVDGQGHTVSDDRYGGEATAVVIEGPVHNVTVRNLTIGDWQTGVAVDDASRVVLRNIAFRLGRRGVDVENASRVTLQGLTFRNMTAESIDVDRGRNVTIDRGRFPGADDELWLDGRNITVSRSVFSNNHPYARTRPIWATGPNLTVVDSVFRGVESTTEIIQADGRSATVRNVTVLDSTSPEGIVLEGTGSVIANTTVRNTNVDGEVVELGPGGTARSNDLVGGKFGPGIAVGPNGTVRSNTVAGGDTGIDVRGSNATLTDNRIERSEIGVAFGTGGATLRDNEIVNTIYPLDVPGSSVGDYRHDIDRSNTVEGLPIRYHVGTDGLVLSDVTAGHLAVVDATNVTVQNATVRNAGGGITLAGVSDARVENVAVRAPDIASRGLNTVKVTNTTITGVDVDAAAYTHSIAGRNVSVSDVEARIVPVDGTAFPVFYDEPAGISVDGTAITLRNATVTGESTDSFPLGSLRGVHVSEGSVNVTVADSTIRTVPVGVGLRGTRNTTVASTTVVNASSSGIVIEPSAGFEEPGRIVDGLASQLESDSTVPAVNNTLENVTVRNGSGTAIEVTETANTTLDRVVVESTELSAVAEDASLSPARNATAPPAGNDTVGVPVEVRPGGDVPLNLTIHYDRRTVERLVESTLAAYGYPAGPETDGDDGGVISPFAAMATGDAKWQRLNRSARDPAANDVRATVSEPTVLAVFGRTAPVFEPTIDGTTSPVVAGEELRVNVSVANPGTLSTTGEVSLLVDGTRRDARNLTLAGGTNTTIELAWRTTPGDAGEHTIAVTSRNDSDSRTVSVLEPANVTISAVSTNGPVVAGENATVNVTVENVGDAAATRTVTLDIDGVRRDARTVSLNGSESTTVTLAWATTDGDAGAHTATLTANNDTATTTVVVDAPANFSTAIDSTTAPVTVGEPLNVSATITNRGDRAGTRTVTLAVGGTGRDSRTLTLAGGNSTRATFTWTPGPDEAGNYTLVVTSSNDAASTMVTVETTQVDVDVTDLAGSGTVKDPYVITNASELQAMEDAPSAHYDLGANISARPTASWNAGAGFDPIGDDGQAFSGTFDGRGYRITGLSIARSGSTDVGLVGRTTADALIQQVTLENASISGASAVGGIVGDNDGTVHSAHATGDIEGDERVGGVVGRNSPDGTVDASYATGEVKGDYGVGGVVGDNRDGGTVISSYSAADVGQGIKHVGGVIGYNFGRVETSYATGNVSGDSAVGGVAGSNAGTVDSSYATGSINGTDDVGGIVGADFVNSGTVVDSYWDVVATGQSTTDGNGTALTTAEFTGKAAVGNLSGFDFNNTWQARPDGYPALGWENSSSPNEANISVRIDSTTAPVAVGGTLEIQAVLSNAGNATGVRTIGVSTNGTRRDVTTVALLPGETKTITLTWQTAVGDTGTYTAVVRSENDTASTAVVVQALANFTTTINSTTAPVVAGETLLINGTITNAGDVRDTQNITLAIDGTRRDVRTVSLNGSESTTVTLAWNTTGSDAGDHTVTVASENDTASKSVSVRVPAFVSTGIDSTTAPVVAGESLVVNATVANTGEVTDTQDITLAVGGSPVATHTVTLGAGDTQKITFTYATDRTDPPRANLTVASEDDTATASATVIEPANLTVTIDSTNAPVVAGDTLSVTATVENTGDVGTTRDITLSVDGSVARGQPVTVAGNSATTVTFTYATGPDDVPAVDLAVSAGNDSDTARAAIRAPANFSLRIDATNDPVIEGENVSVGATVTNTGDVAGTKTVTLRTAGSRRDARNVSLNGSESRTVSLSWATTSGDAGNYTVTLGAPGDTASANVTVLKPATFAVTIDSATTPVTVGDTLRVATTITNTGAVAGTRTVSLAINGTRRGAQSVSLGGGSSTTLTLEWTPGTGESGVYAVVVSSGNDTASTSITVEQNTMYVDVDASDLPGTGTTTDPYRISNASELRAMRDDPDAHYELGTDVNASGTSHWNDGDGFRPVSSFSGSFDGGGHAVTGLTINRSDGTREGTISRVGLFGESSGRVANVTLADVSMLGDLSVGGVVGHNSGVVRNVSVTGTVEGGTQVGGIAGSSGRSAEITGARSSADVNGIDTDPRIEVSDGNEVGGIVGDNTGDVFRSRVAGDVSGNNGVGGIAGINRGTIENAYAIRPGSVTGSERVGGVVGASLLGAVNRSYAALDVSAPIGEAGGLVGSSGFEQFGNNTVRASYWDEEVTGQSSSAVGGTALTTAEMTGLDALDRMDGFDFGGVWTVTRSYPRLAGESAMDPAAFTVSVASTNGPIVAGETVTVDVTVANTGGVPGRQTITLATNGTRRDARSVSLNGSESTTVTLAWNTTRGDARNHTVTVASENDTASGSVAVREPANVSVAVDATTAPVNAGETLSVTVTAENTGDVAGTRNLTLFDTGGDEVDGVTVDLAAGASRSITLNWTTSDEDVGTDTVAVRSANDAAPATITVNPAAYVPGTLRAMLGEQEIPNGTATAVTVTATFTNGTTRDVTDGATVVSNDTGIATVSGDTVTAEDAGTVEIVAGYEGETAAASLTVRALPNLTVMIDAAPSPVIENETVTVTAVLMNTGDIADTQSVTVTIAGSQSAVRTVSLDGGETRTINVSWTPGGVAVGNYTVSVASANDTASTTVRVQESTVCVNRAVAGQDGMISLLEVQSAINWWAEDDPVPETGGETLSLPELQDLINAWAEDESVACES